MGQTYTCMLITDKWVSHIQNLCFRITPNPGMAPQNWMTEQCINERMAWGLTQLDGDGDGDALASVLWKPLALEHYWPLLVADDSAAALPGWADFGLRPEGAPAGIAQCSISPWWRSFARSWRRLVRSAWRQARCDSKCHWLLCSRTGQRAEETRPGCSILLLKRQK